MSSNQVRIRVDSRGLLEFVDPDEKARELLQSIDPGFTVRTDLGVHFCSRLERTRGVMIALTPRRLEDATTSELWSAHAAALTGSLPGGDEQGVSLLDLKIELAWRELRRCRLCAHRCAVNRQASPGGRCGLGSQAIVAEHFLHIAEEPEINPAYVLGLRGCGLRCRYCQKSALLNPQGAGHPLDAALWEKLHFSGARSLEFVGGNPDESIYAILKFMAAAPPAFALPVVWNSHGYGSSAVYRLLSGIVDCYVPDFKYGNDRCAAAWSGVNGYVRAARNSIKEMLSQHVPVLVRILALPGHSQCCHLPALRWLSRYRDSLKIHIMGQYSPDFRILPTDGGMADRPAVSEIQKITTFAESLGFTLIQE